MAYGYTLTAAGRGLLLGLQAGGRMTISRIAVGDGEVPAGTNPAELTGLVHEVARSQATCTVPVIQSDTLCFEVEYRNKWDAGTFGAGYTDPDGLTESFWLKEYGVFALDSDGNEIMLYHADLSGFPEPVAKWNGRNLVSKRYPVSISIVDDNTDVELLFPANAFITAEYLEERLASLSGGFGGGVIISDAEPVGQPVGGLWCDTSEGELDIDYNGKASSGCTVVSDTEPLGQHDGELWFDTSEGAFDFDFGGGGENIMTAEGFIISETEPEDKTKAWLAP